MNLLASFLRKIEFSLYFSLLLAETTSRETAYTTNQFPRLTFSDLCGLRGAFLGTLAPSAAFSSLCLPRAAISNKELSPSPGKPKLFHRQSIAARSALHSSWLRTPDMAFYGTVSLSLVPSPCRCWPRKILPLCLRVPCSQRSYLSPQNPQTDWRAACYQL